jgi:hypothetical protein
MANWTDSFGNELFGVHEADQCLRAYCPIHNVSDHPLKDAPQRWNRAKGSMERVCAHGIAHPDPDDYKARAIKSVHGCDGCCVLVEPTLGLSHD